jgi:hypothetical protein
MFEKANQKLTRFDFALDYKPELGADKIVIFEMAIPN